MQIAVINSINLCIFILTQRFVCYNPGQNTLGIVPWLIQGRGPGPLLLDQT